MEDDRMQGGLCVYCCCKSTDCYSFVQQVPTTVSLQVTQGMWVQALSEVVSCLIDSALQRTPRGGHVDIKMRVRDGGIAIDFIDSGTEMAERLQSLLKAGSSQSQVISLLGTTFPFHIEAGSFQ